MERLKRIKNKGGFMSIYTILWLAVILPFLLFTCMELTYLIGESIHLKGVTDNAGASAVTQIKEELVKQGIIEIDEIQAEQVVDRIISESLNLNEDLSPKDEHSVLLKEPTVQVIIVNHIAYGGSKTVSTPIGEVKVTNPSVVVYAEYPLRGLFFDLGITLKKVGVSQVRFLE